MIPSGGTASGQASGRAPRSSQSAPRHRFYGEVRILVSRYWPRYSEDKLVRAHIACSTNGAMRSSVAYGCYLSPQVFQEITDGQAAAKLDVDNCIFKGMFVYQSDKENLWPVLNEYLVVMLADKFKELALCSRDISKHAGR